MRYLSVLILLSCSFVLSGDVDNAIADDSSGKQAELKQPNVIIVMTDEHNFRTLGCYRERMEGRQAYMWGPAVVETPNIDSLAKGGAICTSFYATTPVCSPSRASFVSGLYPPATAVVSNNIVMLDRVTTFAAILKANGYATGYSGKWHLDGNGKPQWAPKRNFGFTDNRFMFNRGHWKNFELTENGPRVGARKNGQPTYSVGGANEETFATDFLIDRAIEFVNENKSRPFCYMISLPDPHGPDSVRAPYDTMYDEQSYEKPTTYDVDERTIPKWGMPDKKSKFGQSKYYGMVKCIDDNIGKLIDSLKAAEVFEDTIIVFTSDHGDLRGEHHRQNKGIAFEGSARIPFLIHYSAGVAKGTVVDHALSSVDFAPTLMSLCGVKTDAKFHGRDFSGLLKNSNMNWDDIAFVRGTGEASSWLMAVTDQYKLVISNSDKPWLFDLERDPDELVNFVDFPAYRDVLKKMGSQLKRYVKEFSDPMSGNNKVMGDIDWSITAQGEYQSPKSQPNRKNKKRD